jgi:biopolymer transport protein ExbB/TolQ
MGSGLISTIRLSGPMGQMIVLFLFCLSIYSWAVIFSKLSRIKSSERNSARFLRYFDESAGDAIEKFRRGDYPAKGPLARIFEVGCREYLSSERIASNPGPSVESDGIQAALTRAVTEEGLRLEKSMTVLATASSMSPFIGLFGTVWGIMRVFSSMGTTGSATIGAVAPGISAALITTVAGLAVAIPALAFYNLLSSRIRKLLVEMDNFSKELLQDLQRSYWR